MHVGIVRKGVSILRLPSVRDLRRKPRDPCFTMGRIRQKNEKSIVLDAYITLL